MDSFHSDFNLVQHDHLSNSLHCCIISSISMVIDSMIIITLLRVNQACTDEHMHRRAGPPGKIRHVLSCAECKCTYPLARLFKEETASSKLERERYRHVCVYIYIYIYIYVYIVYKLPH